MGLYPGLDFELLPYAFVVVVVGGMGNLTGALVGSVIVGIVDNFGRPSSRNLLFYTLCAYGHCARLAPHRAFRQKVRLMVHLTMRGRSSLPLWVALGALILLPLFLPNYATILVTQCLIYAIVAMSLDILIGYTGLAALGTRLFLRSGPMLPPF